MSESQQNNQQLVKEPTPITHYGYDKMSISGMTFGDKSHERLLSSMLPYAYAYLNSIGFDNFTDERLAHILSEIGVTIHAMTLPYDDSETFLNQYRKSTETGIFCCHTSGEVDDSEPTDITDVDMFFTFTCDLDTTYENIEVEGSIKRKMSVLNTVYLGYSDVSPFPFYEQLCEANELTFNPEGYCIGVRKDRGLGKVIIEVRTQEQFNECLNKFKEQHKAHHDNHVSTEA